ncbi:MAG: amidohydrolase family protein [Pseudomonadota bacterium]|nr:amidohydrolase family protein [Pseudomonadota bacterium]
MPIRPFLLLSVLSCTAQAAEPPVLFKNATVITMDGGRVLEKHDLLVQDGRIARIAPTGTAAAPAGTTVVDGTGRFLLPGLAEMHAHVPGPEPAGYAEDLLTLFVAHGITTIRGTLGQPLHLELRARIERGELIGPRLFTSGPSINGNTAPDAATAERMVRDQKTAGYDFLKLHPGLERDVFDALVATARAETIPFSGHVSTEVGVIHALAAKQSAIDHLDGYIMALAAERCADDSERAGFMGLGFADCADESRIPALVTATKAAGTSMVPTQILVEQWAAPPTDAMLRARVAYRFLSPATIAQWQKSRMQFDQVSPQAQRFLELRHELLRQMHAAGVPILLGSDAPQLFNIPGESTFAELELYGRIGLSPMDALATGTVNVASFFGQEDRFGRLREGLEADVLLLSADPMTDLANVRKLEGVMLRGRWLPRARLDVMLDEIAARQARR